MTDDLYNGTELDMDQPEAAPPKEWFLIIDVALCEDCNNCFLACKDEHVDNEFPGYSLPQPLHGQRWIDIVRKERGQYPVVDAVYLPTPCQHCRNAPCVRAAEDEAVYKREDGIVIIDPIRSTGQKDIVKACPYNAVWWNEDANVPQKCTFCAHLLDDGWTWPRCVQVCPTGALDVVYVEEKEMLKIIEHGKMEELKPEYRTNPRVYYKNLYRFERSFIAGSAAYEKAGVSECAEGANVVLLDLFGETIDRTVTDNFGDFRFDGLEDGGVRYIIDISMEGFEKKSIEVELTESLFVGDLFLEPS